MKFIIAAFPTKIMVTSEEVKHPNSAGNISSRNILIVCLCLCGLKPEKILPGCYLFFGQSSVSMWEVPISYSKSGKDFWS